MVREGFNPDSSSPQEEFQGLVNEILRTFEGIKKEFGILRKEVDKLKNRLDDLIEKALKKPAFNPVTETLLKLSKGLVAHELIILERESGANELAANILQIRFPENHPGVTDAQKEKLEVIFHVAIQSSNSYMTEIRSILSSTSQYMDKFERELN